jgi:hypothetical protein
MSETNEDEINVPPGPPRTLTDWRRMDSETRWDWFDQLWQDACDLRRRYQLPVRKRWWESGIILEALAAMAAWVERYDSGAWDDPPGKLSLLFELERIEAILRDGNDPFDPVRDRVEFEDHLDRIGCEPPPD